MSRTFLLSASTTATLPGSGLSAAFFALGSPLVAFAFLVADTRRVFSAMATSSS